VAGDPEFAPQPEPARAAERSASSWERTLVAELARDALVERRRSRRWRIGLRLAGLVLVVAAAAAAFGWFRGVWQPAAGHHTAMIDIKGVIQVGGEVEAEAVVSALQAAFADRNTAGVVLRINSPGGSPVQAGIIHDEIRRLRKQNSTIPVHAVVEEICASGGYYLAAAADRIFVDKASLIGSIGVVIDGFGLGGLLEKAGIERRLITAGANKGFLDPFSPLSPQQRAHAQQMLDEIHRQFVAVVREGRGNRLRESPDLFSGLVWTGERGIELGLADDFGTVDSVAREVIKAESVVDFTRKDSLFDRLARRMGAAAGEVLAGRLQLTNGQLPLR
jgi:protease-4